MLTKLNFNYKNTKIMHKPILNSLFSLLTLLTIFSHPAKATQITLTNGSNSATYNDDSSANYFGFNNWQVDNQNLLTETGIFYRVNNSGTAQTLDTLTVSNSNLNSNPATITYGDANTDDFTIELELGLNNNGSTLDQTVTVNNTSNSTLDFDLYTYFDLVTSNGNGGDTVAIDNSNYTATQSGDRDTIVTTVTENNTSYSSRRAEVDAIDFNEDTLLQKLRLLSDNDLQLDNDIASISDPNNAVSFAYEWNYSLDTGESFTINFNSSQNSASAVPFEFSPSLGILLVGIFSSNFYLQRKKSR